MDPLSPFLRYLLGYMYSLTREIDNAIEQYRTALELDPQYFLAHWALGSVYIFLSKYEEGIREIETGARILEHSAYALGTLGSAYARAGHIEQAQHMLSELSKLRQKGYVPNISFAYTYFALGDIDQGFDWLEKAVDECYAGIVQVTVNPIYDRLRSHPRYHALLRKMNLEP
jgi:tetratricopeptide (TPR) repeat protein